MAGPHGPGERGAYEPGPGREPAEGRPWDIGDIFNGPRKPGPAHPELELHGTVTGSFTPGHPARSRAGTAREHLVSMLAGGTARPPADTEALERVIAMLRGQE